MQGASSFTARNSVELFFLLFLSVLNFWGMLWECTLRSYRVLRFYQRKTYNYNTCSLYKLMPLLYNLSHYIWVVIIICCTSCITLSCCEDLFQGFCPGFLSKELQKTVSFMGDLYWSSLADSFMDYYWFNLLKRNHFWCGVTVLWPKCYTLEVKLGTIDIAYKYSTITGTRTMQEGGWFYYLRPSRGWTAQITHRYWCVRCILAAGAYFLQLYLVHLLVCYSVTCVLTHTLKCSRKAQECRSLLN